MRRLGLTTHYQWFTVGCGAAFLLLFAGCNTVPNTSPPPVTVPSGLNDNAVELAVLMAIVDTQKLPSLSVGQQITDSVLSAVIGGYTSVQARNAWYFEGREPGVVFAGFQHRGFYMKVAARFTDQQVTFAIIESRNLDQSESRIHKTAFRYLEGLEGRVRRTLGAVAQQVMLNPQTVPAKAADPGA